MDGAIKDRLVAFVLAVVFLLLLGFLEASGWLSKIIDFALLLAMRLVLFRFGA